jgi:hypothetical protein
VTQPTMPPPFDPTPGFYPDSQGVMRLWDGQRWTEVTRPMPQPATPPAGQPGFYPDSQGVMRWWTGRDWAPHTQPPGTGQPEPEKGNWIQRNLGWKLGVLIAGLIWLGSCSAIVSAIGGEDTATTAQPTPAATVATTAPPVDETTEPAPEPEPEPTQEPEPEPEPKPDPVADLKYSIEDALGDSNRDVRRVKVTTSGKAGKPINVKVAFNDNLTGNLVRIGARGDAVDILKAVDADADWKYSEVVIRGTFSMVDVSGNAEESQVVFARYSRKTVNNINFDNFLSTNVWKVADARLIHPEFQ